MPLLRPPSRDLPPHNTKRLLIHNWRTAGTSTSSLLATNFGGRYIKIGVQFNNLGFTKHPKKSQQITQLGEVKARISSSHIVGGHLFAGLEAFLPGHWELWMTARDPIKRAKSGVLRFHGRPYKGSKNPDRDLFSYTGKEKLETPEDLFSLFDQSLRFERNGMCRRLSALRLTNQFAISDTTNLEKIPELSMDFKPDELYQSARVMLDSVRILILTEWYTASVLCLERMLGQGPLLCPFSNLKLNGRNEKHTLEQRRQVVEKADDVLAQIQSADLLLWEDIKKRFQEQVKQYQVNDREIAVRDLIQAKPLLNSEWILGDQYTEEQQTRVVAMAIAKRAHERKELADDAIETMARWQRFTPEAADKIHHYAKKALAKLTS